MVRARPLLGTIVEIRAETPGYLRADATASVATAHGHADAVARLHEAVDAAFDRIELVHRLMSYHDPTSELSRLNRCTPGRAQRVDTHTYNVLSAAVYFARLSAGAFDACVADSLEQWGYLPTTPSAAPASAGPAAPASASHPASWRDIELLSGRRVRFKRPMRLDLGGIAKGYAVDLAIQTLRDAHVAEIVVNAGGDMRVAGDRTHHVHLRHPQTPTVGINLLQLRNDALASSAPYFSRRAAASGRVSALLDPRTREPYVGNNSVSVRARSCMAADALTKVVLFAPASIAERALDECGAEAFVLQGEA